MFQLYRDVYMNESIIIVPVEQIQNISKNKAWYHDMGSRYPLFVC